MAKIFAHRGFSGKYPENTMLAFEKMVETGCAGTELDVQLTKDNQLVIIHDEALERTTNGTGMVVEHTLAELKSLVANATFGDSCPPQRIPTLGEYFEFIKDTGLITNIEMKTGKNQYPGIEKLVIEMIQEFGLEERVWISSFNHYTILRCHALCPQLSYGLLINCWIKDIGEYAQKLHATTVNGETEFLMQREIVEELHAHGIGAQAWTVNKSEQVNKLLDVGVDCIITNFPDMAMEVLKNRD